MLGEAQNETVKTVNVSVSCRRGCKAHAVRNTFIQSRKQKKPPQGKALFCLPVETGIKFGV